MHWHLVSGKSGLTAVGTEDALSSVFSPLAEVALLLLPFCGPKYFSHLCHSCAKLMVLAVQCFVQLVWLFFQLMLHKKALCPLHWHNRGSACNDKYGKLKQAFIGVWEHDSSFWWVLVSMGEQSADFAKPSESFPELGSTIFRSSGFWLSLLEIVTAWV